MYTESKIRRPFGLIVVLVMTVVAVTGCVHQGPILVDFAYQAKAVPEATPTLVVGVSPFRDDRGVSSSVVGKKTNKLNEEAVNDLVVQGTVPDRVTNALKQALTGRGITVKDVPAGDPAAQKSAAPDAKFVIGGEIKTLWVDAVSAFGDTRVKANVELRIQVTDTEQKKVIRTLNVKSAIERANVTFSSSLVEKTLSEALSVATDQIFQDEELKNRLK